MIIISYIVLNFSMQNIRLSYGDIKSAQEPLMEQAGDN